MIKKSVFALLLMFVSISITAQKSIQSTVFDANNGMPLEMVTVRLLKAADSTLVQGVQTNGNGWFSLPRVNPGKYVLVVSSVGYLDYKESVVMDKKDIIFKNIQLQENVLALKELEVMGTAAQLVVRGDTLEYNATAFKVQENAVVEDLLKKLPGVEITAEGKITVNGQEIKKIRVDGKKFFDGDIEMATKNLPAEMIEKIQVLEQKSDMAQLTGFEDEDTERIINLTTKSNRRKGVFGNVNGGAGLDLEDFIRYDANANINIMQGDAQTSIVGGANNVNTARSGRGRGGWGSNNGITETQNLGLNHNAIVNDKFKIGGDGSFNHSNNFSETNSTKESYLKESIFNDSTYNRSNSDSYEANMRLEAEWKIDSLTTLIVQPNINYNTGTSDSYRDYIYLQDLDTTSYGTAQNSGLNNSLSAGLRLIVSRKFASKLGRTLTANVYSGFTQSDNQSFNFSNRISASPTQINQYTKNTSDRLNFDARISFVEPLWNNKNLLETVIAFTTSSQTSVKDQYASTDSTAFFNKNPEDYTTYVDEYSNNFKNKFFRETLEFNYKYTEKAYNLTLGIKGEPSQTHSQTFYGNGDVRDVTNNVFNFAPNGRFQYNFGKKEFMRLDYRGYTRQPSINQMQPVKNNTNLMQETVGNPGLNPSFSNYLRLMYSNFNEKTFSSFSTWISGNYVKDELVTNRIYDSSGKQYTQTVNAEEKPVSLNGNIMFNTPIIQKRLHFNTSTNLGYNTSYGYNRKGLNIDEIDIDNLQLGDTSFTRRYTAQQQLSLTFTHDVIELGARGSLRYSNSLNNLSDRLTETYDWSGRGNIVIRLPYDLSLNSDIVYSNRLGYSNFDQSELIWNASVEKSMFKNRGVLSVKWVDMLRQQLNIRQVVNDNSVSFTKYNTLTSYFLVSFSYRIRQFGGNASRDGDSRMRGDGRFEPGMRPDGGMRSPDGGGYRR
ncbi:MAG: TonB-dependent receptor [Paludibacter sp.]|nr:TonB-dependent receptor [Paludibacter sp.]